MKLWKQILSAVSHATRCHYHQEAGAVPGAGSGVTGRPAILHRPASETERKLMALSIGRATHGSLG